MTGIFGAAVSFGVVFSLVLEFQERFDIPESAKAEAPFVLPLIVALGALTTGWMDKKSPSRTTSYGGFAVVGTLAVALGATIWIRSDDPIRTSPKGTEIQVIDGPSLQECLVEGNRMAFAAGELNSGRRPPESAADVAKSELFILTIDPVTQMWVVRPRGNNQC